MLQVLPEAAEKSILRNISVAWHLQKNVCKSARYVFHQRLPESTLPRETRTSTEILNPKLEHRLLANWHIACAGGLFWGCGAPCSDN